MFLCTSFRSHHHHQRPRTNTTTTDIHWKISSVIRRLCISAWTYCPSNAMLGRGRIAISSTVWSRLLRRCWSSLICNRLTFTCVITRTRKRSDCNQFLNKYSNLHRFNCSAYSWNVYKLLIAAPPPRNSRQPAELVPLALSQVHRQGVQLLWSRSFPILYPHGQRTRKQK